MYILFGLLFVFSGFYVVKTHFTVMESISIFWFSCSHVLLYIISWTQWKLHCVLLGRGLLQHASVTHLFPKYSLLTFIKKKKNYKEKKNNRGFAIFCPISNVEPIQVWKSIHKLESFCFRDWTFKQFSHIRSQSEHLQAEALRFCYLSNQCWCTYVK